MLRRLSAVALIGAAIFLVGASGCSAQGAPVVSGAPLEVSFTTGPRGHVLVDVAVNGHEPLPFALDTGAGRTVLNEARLEGLGLSKSTPSDTLQGAHGVFAMGLSTVASFAIGGAALGPLELGTMDLSGVEGEDMILYGVLGYDVLSQFDLMLDFEKETVAFHPLAADVDGCTVCRGGIELPFRLVGGTHIEFEVGISDQTITSILDTGSGRTGMNYLAAAAIGVKLPPPVPGGHGPSLQIGELRLGDEVLSRDLIVGVVDLPAFTALGYSERPALLLGTGALAGHRVGISYGVMRMSVQ